MLLFLLKFTRSRAVQVLVSFLMALLVAFTVHELVSPKTVAMNLKVGTTTESTLQYGTQGGPYSSTDGVFPSGNWVPYSAGGNPFLTVLPDYNSSVLYTSSATVINYLSLPTSPWVNSWTSWTFSNTPASDLASSWGHPIYFAKSTDPTYTMARSGTTPYPILSTCNTSLATFCPTKLRIPNGAQHVGNCTPASHTAKDCHMELVEPPGYFSAGGDDPMGRPAGEVDAVDFWQAWDTNPYSGGGTINSNYYGALDFNGKSCCGASTLVNQGLSDGVIRGDELAQAISNGDTPLPHALAGVIRCHSPTDNVVPNTYGWFTNHGNACAPSSTSAPYTMARFQLKMSDADIMALALPDFAKVLFKTLAHYGIIDTDGGGADYDGLWEPVIDYSPFETGPPYAHSLMTFFASAAGGSHPDPFTISIGNSQSNSCASGVTTCHIHLSWSDFQVVSPCYSATDHGPPC